MGDYKQFLDELRQNGFEFINLHFTDLFGGWHNLTVPISDLSIYELEHGVPFDGSSVPGFARVESGDMALLPDWNTLFPDTLDEDEPVVGVICDIVDAASGERVSRDPRGILARAEKVLQKRLGGKSFWLPEPEFYIFDDVSVRIDDFEASHKISLGEVMSSGDIKSGFVEPKGGYHSSLPADRGYHFRVSLAILLNRMGIDVRYHHHEVGAGQHEVELIPQPPVKAADNIMLIKYAAKLVAQMYEVAVTFMPKPLYNFPGSGMHFHQWIERDGISLFWDEGGDYAHLSDVALHYIGGLLLHAPALCALTNPSTNSFKRLVPGFEAPTKLFFGLANRSAAVRIPKYVDSPERKRIEYRPPDATANPYFAIAGMLLAGLDGIEKKIDPREYNFGPFDDDVSRWDEERQSALKSLPENLEGAVAALKEDHDFLLADGVFTEDTLEVYTDELERRATEYKFHPTPFEFREYFNV